MQKALAGVLSRLARILNCAANHLCDGRDGPTREGETTAYLLVSITAMSNSNYTSGVKLVKTGKNIQEPAADNGPYVRLGALTTSCSHGLAVGSLTTIETAESKRSGSSQK